MRGVKSRFLQQSTGAVSRCTAYRCSTAYFTVALVTGFQHFPGNRAGTIRSRAFARGLGRTRASSIAPGHGAGFSNMFAELA